MKTKIFSTIILCGVLIISSCQGKFPITEIPSLVAPTLTPTNVSSQPQKFDDEFIIALASKEYGSLFLVEARKGEYQEIEIPNDKVLNIYSWSANGCNLFIGTEENEILKMNIVTRMTSKIIDIDDIHIGENIVLGDVSPSEEWIYFFSRSGVQEYIGFETENIVVIQIGNGTVYNLTNNTKKTRSDWHPVNDLIAFNDEDTNSFQQIYISLPDGSNRQVITDFDGTITIKALQWSPNGEMLAVVVENINKLTDSLLLFNFKNEDNLREISEFENIGTYWWLSNEVIVADVVPLNKDVSITTNRIVIWYDAMTLEKLGVLESNDIYYLVGPVPYSNQFGFFESTNFFVHDIYTSKTTQLFNKFTDIRYWVSSPYPFSKAKCESQN